MAGQLALLLAERMKWVATVMIGKLLERRRMIQTWSMILRRMEERGEEEVPTEDNRGGDNEIMSSPNYWMSLAIMIMVDRQFHRQLGAENAS